MPDEAQLALPPEETAKAPVDKSKAPKEQVEGSAKLPSPSKQVQPSPRPRRLRGVLFALLPIALIVGAYWYVTGGQVMSTDNAYIQAETVGISTDVSGIVNEVNVTDNQHVDAGQVLYSLDPRQFMIALANAKANLAETAQSLDAMKQDYRRMLSDVTVQRAQVALDQSNYDRYASLVGTKAIAKESYDQARFTLEANKSKLESQRLQATVQLARLNGDPDLPVTQLPQYMQAKAQVDEAQRQLDHTIVKAPFGGIVTQVPSIAAGKYLAASATAFYLIDMDHLWIEANPKETELTYVQPGQHITVTVDTYPGVEWSGIVASISPAAAQQFSLLPAQNTSGNWVKVVQRIAMRVHIDTHDKTQPPLRAGMSVEVNVDTGHPRGLPDLVKAWFGRTPQEGP
jgi:membrane fusion protein (multidrug efflux system)